MSPRSLIACCAWATFCAVALAPFAGAQSFGRAPVRSFGLESPPPPPPVEDRSAETVARAAGALAGFADEILKPGISGRVQLFSVSRLTAEDLANPFEIRVHVQVDVRETRIEIGGIIEGADGKVNTAIIRMEAPTLRKRTDARPDDDKPPERDVFAIARAQRARDQAPAAAAPPPSIRRVCSVGDMIEGFRIEAIFRNSVILQHQGKYVEITRGAPVTICIPLSAL
ncbi:hypothetical protein OpiT1DRAFT_04467 [Opitutaceae bacterium TAV1]|nr:hypothetical protein OpiT1DRAFT_04467 [Opitutaceae bacterium TAV1]